MGQRSASMPRGMQVAASDDSTGVKLPTLRKAGEKNCGDHQVAQSGGCVNKTGWVGREQVDELSNPGSIALPEMARQKLHV